MAGHAQFKFVMTGGMLEDTNSLDAPQMNNGPAKLTKWPVKLDQPARSGSLTV